MKPYHVIKNRETLETAIQYSEIPLENSIEYKDNFLKAVFNQYPNPTKLIESATPEEIEAFKKEEIPNLISMMKLRMILVLMGTSMENVISKIDKLPIEVIDDVTKKLVLIKLEYATHLERNSPELIHLGKLLFTDEQLDNIFINGNKIQ
jgi:hypothetical protein